MTINRYDVELTDTFAGEPNYSWVRRAVVDMPEPTYYGYTGSADGSYTRANRVATRELMRKAKAAVGLTGARGRRETWGDMEVFYPAGSCTVLFVTYRDE